MANDKSKYNPYDYVAVLRTDKEAKTVGEGRVMARDAEHAKMLAAFKLDQKNQDAIDDITITVRPF